MDVEAVCRVVDRFSLTAATPRLQSPSASETDIIVAWTLIRSGGGCGGGGDSNGVSFALSTYVVAVQSIERNEDLLRHCRRRPRRLTEMTPQFHLRPISGFGASSRFAPSNVHSNKHAHHGRPELCVDRDCHLGPHYIISGAQCAPSLLPLGVNDQPLPLAKHQACAPDGIGSVCMFVCLPRMLVATVAVGSCELSVPLCLSKDKSGNWLSD
ncbi:hypothetical protein CBL_00673 [Carabus blaptoides fortunei]